MWQTDEEGCGGSGVPEGGQSPVAFFPKCPETVPGSYCLLLEIRVSDISGIVHLTQTSPAQVLAGRRSVNRCHIQA